MKHTTNFVRFFVRFHVFQRQYCFYPPAILYNKLLHELNFESPLMTMIRYAKSKDAREQASQEGYRAYTNGSDWSNLLSLALDMSINCLYSTKPVSCLYISYRTLWNIREGFDKRYEMGGLVWYKRR